MRVIEKTPLLTPEFLSIVPNAAENYHYSLRLPDHGPVLVITDRPDMRDPSVQARRAMVAQIEQKLQKTNHPFKHIEFNETTPEQTMYNLTSAALYLVDQLGNGSARLTVIYCGAQWPQRKHMYNAVGEFSSNVRHVAMAISPLLNVPDITLMAKITPEMLARMNKGIDYYKEFFQQHLNGTLMVYTRYNGFDGTLTVPFDTTHAPFYHERGVLDDANPMPHPTDKGPIFTADNVLGAESSAAPYPYTQTHGTFVSKEGILFTVENGLLVSARGWEAVQDQLEPQQHTIVTLLGQGRQIPLVELGLGAFTIAGLTDIPLGTSTYMSEKQDPHFGIGRPGNDTQEEKTLQELSAQSGFDQHTDFVLPHTNTEIILKPDSHTSHFPVSQTSNQTIPFRGHASPIRLYPHTLT